MLTYVEGDLFSSPAQVIVNTVNTVGVMGKGIALEFKKRYPDMFENYKKVCDKHNLQTGKLMLWYGKDHWILLFPTKEHWRNPSKMEYIEKGLMAFTRKYASYNITSIAFPKLGCGNGELNWNEVRPLMEKYLANLPIDVYIYLGPKVSQKPEHKKQDDMSEWMKENAKDLSFVGLKDEISTRTMLIPIEMEMNGEMWEVYWPVKGNLNFTNHKEKYFWDENEIQSEWDQICERRLFVDTGEKKKSLFYRLLVYMGYMQDVSVLSDHTGEMSPGYQLEMGKARRYWLRGEQT